MAYYNHEPFSKLTVLKYYAKKANNKPLTKRQEKNRSVKLLNVPSMASNCSRCRKPLIGLRRLRTSTWFHDVDRKCTSYNYIGYRYHFDDTCWTGVNERFSKTCTLIAPPISNYTKALYNILMRLEELQHNKNNNNKILPQLPEAIIKYNIMPYVYPL